ncbi:MAG: hypothetical protein KDC34_02065 [Saprospiraceae bacterium]|nr:hypothetical protein [Saprospiraceae bacterium]
MRSNLTQLLFTFLSFCCLGTLTAQEPLSVSFGDLRARSIGPALMSGRVVDIEGVNSDSKKVYIGSASGGIWYSANGGADFRPIFDEYTMSIGHITVDQNHPDTIWVGTGEPWTRNSVSVGEGLFRSLNGGKTWTKIGFEDSERISNIIVDPTNSAIVYVAVQGHLWGPHKTRGIYKTTDFGQTWEQVLYVDENTGAADMSMDPTDPNTLFVSMWDHRRTPDYFVSGGPGSGLFKTTDGGANWTKVTAGLPAGKLGRLAVAIAPSNADIVYVTVEAEKKEDKGLYRSEDGGATWTFVSSDFNVTVRPFYFSRLVVDPVNPDKLFKCGLNLTVSEDGGKSWRTVGSGVHSDLHDVWVNPNMTDMVFCGTDGGAYRSLDGGYLFEMFMDLPLSQFYAVTVDNAEPFNVYGGLQDNGSWYGPSASAGGVANRDWDISNWGDGFHSIPHPTDSDIVYSESQGGNLVRHNKKDGQSKDIKPIEEEGDPDYRWNWNTPIQVSPNNPERLYVAAQFLFQSDDRGNSWTKISPDLTTNNPDRQRQKTSGGLSVDNSAAENNTTIYVITESPLNGKVIWVGTDDGNLQLTRDGGKSWTNVAPNIPGLPAFTWCTGIEPSHFDDKTCYVTFDGHKQGDKTSYVFKTTDSGATWTSLVTDDIEGYALSIREDLESSNLLFLGTEFGLYISMDSGLSWKAFRNNLPRVGVRAMVIHPRDNALVLATHGRGIFILDDIRPLRQITAEVAAKKLEFLDLGPTYFRLEGPSAPFGGSGNFVGQNPDTDAKIVYYMEKRHTFGKMSMDVYDSEGNLIKTLPAGKSAGINIVSLPTRLPMPKAAPTNNRMALFGSVLTPGLAEGVYTVKINKGNEVYETTFELLFDPKHEANYPAKDRKLARETQLRLYNMTNQLGYIYFMLEDMQKQAEMRVADVSKKKDKELIEAFAREVEKYKDGLVSLEGDFYVDEGSNIREDISTLYLGMSQYPGSPSEGQIRKTGELEGRMATVQSKFDGFVSRMNAINEKLVKLELAPIAIKTMEAYLEQ